MENSDSNNSENKIMKSENNEVSVSIIAYACCTPLAPPDKVYVGFASADANTETSAKDTLFSVAGSQRNFFFVSIFILFISTDGSIYIASLVLPNCTIVN